MILRDKGWLTHSGMTDAPTPTNIISFLRIAYHEKQLRDKEASLEEWLEIIGKAPNGRFNSTGKYRSMDFDQDLISYIKQNSRFQDGYWHTDMPHPKGPKDPISILHLTDLHMRKNKAKRFMKMHENLLGKQYDLVVLTGDIVHESIEDLTAGPLGLLRDIDSKHKLFTRGNHDGHTWADSQKVSDLMESKTGFKDISYVVESIDLSGFNVAVSGIPDRSLYKTSPHFQEKSWMMAIYDNLPLLEGYDFRIGAFHRPCDVLGAFEENGRIYKIPDDAYNLILAGHIHDYGINLMGFNAKFWLGFHGVDDGLNHHKGGYMMPSEDTIFSVSPGSLEMIYLRLPIIRTYIPLFPRFGVRKAGGEMIKLHNQEKC